MRLAPGASVVSNGVNKEGHFCDLCGSNNVTGSEMCLYLTVVLSTSK